VTTLLAILLNVAYYAVVLYIVILIVRFVLDWITVINRSWRPRGLMLILAEVTFTLTDPPLRTLRRLIPPLVIGELRLDFGWSITLLACFLALSLIQGLGSVLAGVF
jgi:YggT family protein